MPSILNESLLGSLGGLALIVIAIALGKLFISQPSSRDHLTKVLSTLVWIMALCGICLVYAGITRELLVLRLIQEDLLRVKNSWLWSLLIVWACVGVIGTIIWPWRERDPQAWPPERLPHGDRLLLVAVAGFAVYGIWWIFGGAVFPGVTVLLAICGLAHIARFIIGELRKME